ncbi:14287_t:CDS:2, partial [Rhizophagus irregularis]
MDISGPLRRFITDETSQKDPQDALKLTKRYKSTHNIVKSSLNRIEFQRKNLIHVKHYETSQKEPSKRFETDKTSQKNPQDALKLMKHLE